MKKRISGKKEKPSGTFGKVWHFLWDSNSIWSWLIDLVVLYIFVKFIFFPALSFALATPLPSVIVQTSSMTHDGKEFSVWWDSFGGWYLGRNISEAQAYSWQFRNGFDKGDIMILYGDRDASYESLKIGDSIVFQTSQPIPIIHRIIALNSDGTFATKGDNNNGQLDIEKSISRDKILGKAVVRIPKIGWLKLFPLEFFHNLFR